LAGMPLCPAMWRLHRLKTRYVLLPVPPMLLIEQAGPASTLFDPAAQDCAADSVTIEDPDAAPVHAHHSHFQLQFGIELLPLWVN
jgi:hypothetical protein